MLLGGLLLIVCGLLWVGTGIITSAAALRKENLFWIQGGSAVVVVAVCLLYMLVDPGSRITGGIRLMSGLLVFAGICNALTFYWMGKAMKRGPNGMIWVIVQSALIGPFLMGVLCFHDHCSVWKVLGLVLVLVGVVCGSLVKNEDRKKHFVLSKWLPMALLAFAVTVAAQCFNTLPSYLILILNQS